jgi:hypothetical protein
MPINAGVIIPVTSATLPSIGNAWASVAASAGKRYQLVGYSGGCSRHAASVYVYFNSTLLTQSVTVGKSGCAAQEYYGDLGPITNGNQGIVVRTWGQPGCGPCYANLLYRIVF